MARPRTHTSNEDRQRAYRARKQVRAELLKNMDDLAQTIMQHCTPAQRADLIARLTADQQDAADTTHTQDEMTHQHEAYEALHHAYTVLHQDHAVLQANYADLQNTHTTLTQAHTSLQQDHDTLLHEVDQYNRWRYRRAGAYNRLKEKRRNAIRDIVTKYHIQTNTHPSHEDRITTILKKFLPEPSLGPSPPDDLCIPLMSEADLERLLAGEFIHDATTHPHDTETPPPVVS